jgi:hypothetical protein
LAAIVAAWRPLGGSVQASSAVRQAAFLIWVSMLLASVQVRAFRTQLSSPKRS